MRGLCLDLARLAIAGVADGISEVMSGDTWARPVCGNNILDVETSVSRGLLFLRQHQRADGSFRGFLLLPGASTEWITAHVAFVLESVPGATDICERAAHYLHSSMGRFGCGYNARVGEDNDSTAQAHLVMNRFGLAVDGPALQAIVNSQFFDGGFPTYRPIGKDIAFLPNGWYYPHADVTAVVIALLERLELSPHATKVARHWLSEQLVEGVLPSYWWRDWHYGLWAQSHVGMTDEQSYSTALALAVARSPHPFTGIALNSALCHSRDSTSEPMVIESVKYLCSTQWKDGSWPCDPILRVTSQRVVSAGPDTPGRTYRDRRRVFSTAHTVAALWRFGDARTT